MQIEIYAPNQGQPLPPVEWNFAEVKQWVQDGLEAYKGRVYTDDTIALAKKDRATLNKLAEAIDTKRKEMKAKYLEPYEEFEGQTKELKAMIKDQVAEIDAQVKAHEKFKKAAKLEGIKIELYGPMIGKLADLVPYEKLHDPKWLNVSTSISTISTELGGKIDRIISGLETIDKLDYPADVKEVTRVAFLRNFRLDEAIAETEAAMKCREAQGRLKETTADGPRIIDASDPDAFKKARPGDIVRFGGPGCVSGASESTQPEGDRYTPPNDKNPLQGQTEAQETEEVIHTEPQEEVHTIELDFRVWVTRQQMAALKEFLNSNGIKFGRVPKESEA